MPKQSSFSLSFMSLVEDPNDAFSDMRDKNDMRYLSEHDAFRGLKAPVPMAVIETMRKMFKLTKVNLFCFLRSFFSFFSLV